MDEQRLPTPFNKQFHWTIWNSTRTTAPQRLTYQQESDAGPNSLPRIGSQSRLIGRSSMVHSQYLIWRGNLDSLGHTICNVYYQKTVILLKATFSFILNGFVNTHRLLPSDGLPCENKKKQQSRAKEKTEVCGRFVLWLTQVGESKENTEHEVVKLIKDLKARWAQSIWWIKILFLILINLKISLLTNVV